MRGDRLWRVSLYFVFLCFVFLARQNKSSERAIVVILALLSASTSVSRFDVLVQVFEVMAKALSGKLSCYWTGLVFIPLAYFCHDFVFEMPYLFPLFSQKGKRRYISLSAKYV